MSIPVTVFIGTLVALIILLVLLMAAVTLWLKRHKLKNVTCLARPDEYDDVIERNRTREVLRAGSEISMEMKVNEAYEPTVVVKAQSREDEDGHGLYEEIH